jgi:hypothetical protein
MSQNYKCYACAEMKTSDELRYECMCTEKMGVCKGCVNVPTNQWKIALKPDHHLQKLHDITSEYKNMWNTVERVCGKRYGGWSESESQMTVEYFEGPNGEKDEEFNNYLEKTHGFNYVYYLPEEIRTQYRKKAVFDIPKKICTCC